MAIAWPVKLILTSVSSRRRLSSTNFPRRQNPGSAGAPCGSRAAAAWIRAVPPLICHAVATDAGGGPSKKRPKAPDSFWSAPAADAAVSSQVAANC